MMSLFVHKRSGGGTTGSGGGHSPATGGQNIYPPRIACFVCGTEGPADYPLFAEPPPTSPSPSPSPSHTPLALSEAGTPELLHSSSSYSAVTPSWPHFPFLLIHPPPPGCSPLSPGAREAKACRPCHLALLRQWETYERTKVPLIKRTYWVKRSDGLSFQSPEMQMNAAAQLQAQIHIRNNMPAPMEPPVGGERGKSAPCSLLPTSWPTLPGLATSGLSRNTSNRTESSSIPPTSGSVGAAGGDNDSALDLSSGSKDRENMKSRSSVVSQVSSASHLSGYPSEGATSSSTDTIDLTLPDKNASFEVCYVCGDEYKRGLLSSTFTKLVNKEPFYPSLMSHARPPRSRPIDASGRVQTCDDCHNHLLAQWNAFEEDQVGHPDRKYTLRKRNAPQIDTTTFVCYICALEYHSNALKLLYARPNSEEEPYYPFIEQLRPQPGASPISPQGMVQVCDMCSKNTKEKHHGFVKENQPPLKKRRGNSFSLLESSSQATVDGERTTQLPEEEDKSLPADMSCLLCRRKFAFGSFKLLHTQGPPVGGLPYFSFLFDLAHLGAESGGVDSALEDDKQKRVRACQSCNTNLINQWTQFQRDNVAVEDRKYIYACQSSRPRSICSVRAQSPMSQASGSGPNKPVVDSTRPRSNTLESKARSSPNPSPSFSTVVGVSGRAGASSLIPPADCHSPSFSTHSGNSTAAPIPSSNAPAATSDSYPIKPIAESSNTVSTKPSGNASSFYCFLCGLHSEFSFSRMLYSTAPGRKAPYFPFMKSHVPKNKAETLREDGTALVCTFCYHSVMVQWTKFNESKLYPDPKQRKYNIHDYNCYVCSITTYRKRIRALRVLDFPFLRQHKSSENKGIIKMENGEMVAVCLDCFESLRGQFAEGERYGIPIEKRQYNWMRIPPPPEDSSSHITTPSERLLQVEEKSSKENLTSHSSIPAKNN